MSSQQILYMKEAFLDSYEEELFGQPEFTGFLNPQAGSPITLHFGFSGNERSEATNEGLDFHFDALFLDFRQESEDSSSGSFQSFHKDQQIDSSQGSTLASPSDDIFLNSPTSSEDLEMNYKTGRKKPFTVIRSNKPRDQGPSAKRKRPAGSYSRQTKQNKMKNYPGLITQRLKTKLTNDGEFLTRILKFVNVQFTPSKKQGFLQYVQEYCKDWKTWARVSAYLNRDPVFGPIFQKIILEFLTEKFEDDYEEWLVNGKMNEKSKELLRNSKSFFIQGFSSLSLGGLSEEEDDSEIEEFYPTTSLKKLKIY